MYNLLVNWETLKAYFTCFEQNYARYQVKYKARMIKEMLSDYKNYLYFVFATPIVQEFKGVNILFQSTQQDPHVLQKELFMHKTSFLRTKYMMLMATKKCCIMLILGLNF